MASRLETSFSSRLFDISFATTPAMFTLHQQAGKEVGLQVLEVSILAHESGTKTAIPEGLVGIRYMTGDGGLLYRFNAKVAELQAAAQVTATQ